jgi:hypothetical protein
MVARKMTRCSSVRVIDGVVWVSIDKREQGRHNTDAKAKMVSNFARRRIRRRLTTPPQPARVLLPGVE